MTSAHTHTPSRAAPLTEVRRAGTRFRTVADGIDTWHSFSFSGHYDPDNIGFGSLTVHNDDRVEAGHGYDEHFHPDAEIVTWVLSGSLRHTDSTGHRGVVGRGLVQRLSAGSGVRHTERNDAYPSSPADLAQPGEPVHFVQMWLRPDLGGRPPEYTQAEVDFGALADGWVPVVSGKHPDAVLRLGSQASTLWVTTLRPGERRSLPTAERLHLFVARGTVAVEPHGELHAGDAVRALGGFSGEAAALTDAELLAWELAP